MIHPHGLQTKSRFETPSLSLKNIQPNALDVRLDRLFMFDYMINDLEPESSRILDINDEKVNHYKLTEMFPSFHSYPSYIPSPKGVFMLQQGVYQFLTDTTVNVSQGEVGWLMGRSSLIRNGVFVTTGLYDSGFNGLVGGVINVQCPAVRIERGTRVAQFVLFKAETIGQYDGSYGSNKDYDKENYKKEQ